MHIAIIGTGQVGSALARGLKGSRHTVCLGARDPAAKQAIDLADETGARLRPPAKAAADAEMVILALPWAVAEAAIAPLGDLAGKIVIDCMNPLGMVDGALGLTVGHTQSGGEIVADWLPDARVVKTLNQTGAEILGTARSHPHRPAMFMAGDDPEAKNAASELLTDLGFQPMDAGGIQMARLLEPHAMVWINQAIIRDKGRNWAFCAVDADDDNPR